MIGTSEIFLFLFIPVFVFVIVLWFWMLIDCLKRQDDKFKIGGNNAKLIWILVIIFTGLIGALIYYFLIKRTDSRQDRLIGIALVASVFIIIIFIASQFVVTTRTTVSIEPYPPGKLQSTSTITMNGTIENITIPCPSNIQCNPVYWLAGEDDNTYRLLISSGIRLPDGSQQICEGLLALQEPCLTKLPHRGQLIEVIGIVTYDTASECGLSEQEVHCQPIGRINVSSWQPR
ncbi:MAG: PLDc_N domain-containing protein [Nitrospirae bacterium]|nr:PLDc_N domain-containing protein [Nitrospirota bacterium]